MLTLHFSSEIAAPRENVWRVMLEHATYRDWTSAFADGSHYKGSWETGGKLLFLEGNGQAGMVSMVRENRPHEFIGLEHIGIVKDGVEDTASEESAKWAPAQENYRLTETATGTRLDVEMDVPEEMREYFEKTWPKALARLKIIAER
jgi:hypothetical protein